MKYLEPSRLKVLSSRRVEDRGQTWSLRSARGSLRKIKLLTSRPGFSWGRVSPGLTKGSRFSDLPLPEACSEPEISSLHAARMGSCTEDALLVSDYYDFMF